MDSGVIIMLIALFVFITSITVVLMLMLPEWFGISKGAASVSASPSVDSDTAPKTDR